MCCDSTISCDYIELIFKKLVVILVLMYFGTESPASTAFFANSPAVSMTVGLDVLVQEAMEAIRTEP